VQLAVFVPGLSGGRPETGGRPHLPEWPSRSAAYCWRTAAVMEKLKLVGTAALTQARTRFEALPEDKIAFLKDHLCECVSACEKGFGQSLSGANPKELASRVKRYLPKCTVKEFASAVIRYVIRASNRDALLAQFAPKIHCRRGK